MLKVKATSFAEKSWPSDHFTPWRVWKVSVVLLLLQA
jgi:hypothetical protein